MLALSLHPLIDGDIKIGTERFTSGTLRCHCATDKVEVQVDTQVAHNHVCGCSKCWKPKGAVFSVVGVVPRDNTQVTANAHKLKVIDPGASIQRYACTGCGAHMLGRVEKKEHHFFGLDFIHTELSGDEGWAAPRFAAFVSSVIENGTSASAIDSIRARLKEKGLEPYDAFSPFLMDMIAAHSAKMKGVFKD